jgi:DNA-directed RNA polymerase sigma subunit (sigma70/sigma32)
VDARQRLEAAVRRVQQAEKELANSRSALRSAIIAAHRAGMSLTEIGVIVGVSRQRVKQIINGADRG